MESFFVIAIIIVVILILNVISKVFQKIHDLKNTNNSLRQTISELKNFNIKNSEVIINLKRIECNLNQKIQQQGQEIHVTKNACSRIHKSCEDVIKRKDKEIMTILNESSQCFPWLSRAIANYELLKDFQRA